MKEHLARLSFLPQPQNNTRNHSPIFSCPYYFLTPIIIILVYFYFSLLPTLTLSLTILYILMRNVNVNVNLIFAITCSLKSSVIGRTLKLILLNSPARYRQARQTPVRRIKQKFDFYSLVRFERICLSLLHYSLERLFLRASPGPDFIVLRKKFL